MAVCDIQKVDLMNKSKIIGKWLASICDVQRMDGGIQVTFWPQGENGNIVSTFKGTIHTLLGPDLQAHLNM